MTDSADLQKIPLSTSLDQTLHTIAHDVRAPIRNILTFAKFLEMDNPTLSSDSKDHLLEINHAAKSLEILLQGLLAVGKNWLSVPVFAKADLQDILEKAIDRDHLTEAGIILTIQPNLPQLICDAAQIQTLFEILIANAIKFRSQDSPEITIGSTTIDCEPAFFVQDNGLGIPPKNQHEVGTLFRQFHPKEQYPGKGVGLCMAKDIINRHNGNLYLKSTLGEGSAFYVTLPQTQEPVR